MQINLTPAFRPAKIARKSKRSAEPVEPASSFELKMDASKEISEKDSNDNSEHKNPQSKRGATNRIDVEA